VCGGCFAASPPLCNRCFSRVRQRQRACRYREKIRRTPSGAGKISPSICVPPPPSPHTLVRPRLVSPPLRQSGKRHQRRRAASFATQPADPNKVKATSGSTNCAPAPLLGLPPVPGPRQLEGPGERKGALHSPRGGGSRGRSPPPFRLCRDPGGLGPPDPIIHLPDSRCRRPRKSVE
jgi:hypothetical protein